MTETFQTTYKCLIDRKDWEKEDKIKKLQCYVSIIDETLKITNLDKDGISMNVDKEYYLKIELHLLSDKKVNLEIIYKIRKMIERLKFFDIETIENDAELFEHNSVRKHIAKGIFIRQMLSTFAPVYYKN